MPLPFSGCFCSAFASPSPFLRWRTMVIRISSARTCRLVSTNAIRVLSRSTDWTTIIYVLSTSDQSIQNWLVIKNHDWNVVALSFCGCLWVVRSDQLALFECQPKKQLENGTHGTHLFNSCKLPVVRSSLPWNQGPEFALACFESRFLNLSGGFVQGCLYNEVSFICRLQDYLASAATNDPSYTANQFCGPKDAPTILGLPNWP